MKYNPEKLNNVEIGVKTDFELAGMKARTNVDAYYGFYTGYQQPNLFTVNVPGVGLRGVTATGNVGQGHVEGLEAEITIIPVDDLILSGNFNWNHNKFETDITQGVNYPNTHFTYDPKFSGSGKITYHLSWLVDKETMGDLSVSGTYSYISMLQASITPAQTVTTGSQLSPTEDLGFNVTWSNFLGHKSLEAQAYVTNALNDLWGVGNLGLETNLGVNPRYLKPPRMFGASMRYTFGEESAEMHTTEAAYTPPPVTAPKMAPAPHSYLVFFDFDKSDLTPQATQIVDQAAQNAGPSHVTRIDVTGHTDTVGSDAYNMRLSKRRAESVAAELEHQGVPSSEISIIAKGKHDLLVPTADGVREPQNRRVEIVYEGGMGAGM